jgi:hypothetical protein
MDGYNRSPSSRSMGFIKCAEDPNLSCQTQLMGHSDIRTTMKYVHAATSSKKAAVDLLVEFSDEENGREEKKWLKNGSN